MQASHPAFIDNLIDIFEQGFMPSLLLGGVVLLMVSQKSIIDRPTVERWGLRIGVLGFLAWYVRDFLVNGLWGAEQFFLTGLRALLVLLYTTATAWLLLAITSCGRGLLASQFTSIDPIRGWRKARRQARTARPSPVSEPILTPAEERERQRQEAGAEAARLRRQREQAERDKIRYEVGLLYDRYRAELTDKLPQDRFDAYFATYLTPDLEPSVYTERAEKLKDMIRDRLNVQHRSPAPQFDSVEDIIRYFTAKKASLLTLGLDQDTLETLEVTYDEMQDREVRKLLTN